MAIDVPAAIDTPNSAIISLFIIPLVLTENFYDEKEGSGQENGGNNNKRSAPAQFIALQCKQEVVI